jgi:hypothetical protein
MKILRTTLSLLIFLLSFQSFGQSKVGSTKDQIVNDYVAKNYEFMDGLAEDGTYYISREASFGAVVHYIDDYDNCIATLVFPIDDATMQKYKTDYKTKYKLLEENVWSIATTSGSTAANRVSVLNNEGEEFIMFYREEQ